LSSLFIRIFIKILGNTHHEVNYVKYTKFPFLFCVGGLGYTGLELLWRGWTHSTMFLAGGTCFLLLGTLKRQPPWVKAVAGAGMITAVELGTGLLVNRQYQIWDYRSAPLNFLGQICLPYTLLWMPLALAGAESYRFLEKKMMHT
jgi:hypothetical protein